MNRPLNFLHISTFYPPYSFGGDAMYLHRLAHALGDAGHNVDVIHCVDSFQLLSGGEPKIRFLEHPRVKRHELRSPFGWLSPLATQQTGRPFFKMERIAEVLASKPYDVVHYHNMSLMGARLLAVEPPRGLAVKLYTTHEHWLVCPTHVLWKYDEGPCRKPDCLRCTLYHRRPPQAWRYTGLLDRMARHVDAFVSPSRFTARMHAERGFSRPVGHLPYFIARADEDWMHPAPPPQPRPFFLFAGRLEIIKGLQTLIRVWEKVPDYDLLVAGTGTYEPELRKMAAHNPRIKFLGALSQAQMGPLFYHALACIIPSITYETFGMITIEAFARKTPVIVRDLGALPEVVNDAGAGLICNTDDEFAAAIAHIAGSPALRAELGESGYRSFLKWWCTEAHLKLYFGLLREIAANKFGSVPWETTECTAIPAR